jgi:hypothetical protein
MSPNAGRTQEVKMSDYANSPTANDRELRWFVEDYCGCGPKAASDPVGEACSDAALMLAQQTAG